MEFYKENSVNPFGSCLPLVLQLPVFFALFFVLRHFSRTRQADRRRSTAATSAFLGGFIPNITQGHRRGRLRAASS